MRNRKRIGRHDAAVKARAHRDDTNGIHSSVPLAPNRLVMTSFAVGSALAALVLGVYVKTLYPSVTGGDSGELVAESCHLGVSHPPGYPLFNMAVHAFINALSLPWWTKTTVAWRANLFSAICDTLAAVMLYVCILHYARSSGAVARHTTAFSAAALFALSSLIWTYAVGAEVFALNNMFAALLVYLLLRYDTTRSLQDATMGALVSGLALCNQHTIVLFELPIVGWVLWTRRATLWGRELVQLSTAFLVSLLPYAYMPIAMSLNPQPGSWGTTLSGFFHHVRRGDYGTFRLFSTNATHEDLWTHLHLYAVDLSSREIPLHLAVPISALGLLVSLRSPRKQTASKDDRGNAATGRLLLVTYTFYMIVFHSLANLPLSEGLTYGVHMRFWQQPNLIVFLWFGIGLHEILDIATKVLVTRCGSGESGGGRIAQIFVIVLLHALCLSLVGLQVAMWYELCDQSQAFYIRDYARALLDPLPKDAVLIVNFDLQWTSLRYLQRCEHRRTDVTILNLSMMMFAWFATKHAHYPSLSFPGMRLVPFGAKTDGSTFASFLDANYQPLSNTSTPHRRGIFFGGKLNYQDQDFHSKYTFTPYGLVDEIHRKEDTTSLKSALKLWYKFQKRVMGKVRVRLPVLPPGDQYNDEMWEWTIARDYGMKMLSWSTYLLEKTIQEDPLNVALLSEATHAMEPSYQFEPLQFWNPAANLKNLGFAYAQIVKSNEDFDGNDPFLNDAVGSSVEDKSRFKDRASARMLEVWHAWLQIPEARHDPGFDAIKGVVRQFVPESVGEQPANKDQTAQKRAKRRKKKAAKPKKKTTTQ
ncbi:Membrane protein, partial [Globisporangium splendens]